MVKEDVKPDTDAKDKKSDGGKPEPVTSKESGDSDSDAKGGKPVAMTEAELKAFGDRVASAVMSRKDEELAEKIKSVEEDAERTRLVEAGKYQELAEKYKGETETLKAERERAKFIGDAHEALKSLELSDFQDVLLKDSSTIEGVKERATELEALVEVRVEALVAKRLNTEVVPKTPKPGPEDPNWGVHISTEDWQEKKKKLGIY